MAVSFVVVEVKQKLKLAICLIDCKLTVKGLKQLQLQ